MEEVKEEENRVTRKRNQVKSKEKRIRFKKPDIKIGEFVRSNKKQILWFCALVVIIIFAILCINYDKFGLVINKNITDDNATIIELISSNSKIYSFGDEVLVSNIEGITTYNEYGNITWELKLQGVIDDEIQTNGKYLQIINKDKSFVYIYKNKYETARIKVEGTILSGYINKQGYSVIEYTTPGNNTILAVYDSKGNLKYNVKMGSDIIGKYVLSDDAKYIVYIAVNIKGISASSSVVLIRLGGEEEDAVKTLYTSQDSLIYDVAFSRSNVVYRLEDKVVSQNINNLEMKVSKLENTSIVNLDFYKNKYAYVISESGKYLLGVNNIGGKDKSNIELKEMPKRFIYNNGNVFVCNQKQIEVYNSFNTKIKEYNSSMVITEPIIFGEGKNVAFLVSNKLIMFSI